MTPARRADLAFFGTVAAALICLVAFGVLQRRVELIGQDDFSRIWAGPRAVVIGVDPYDPSSWAATARDLGTQAPDTSVVVYPYPPWVTMFLLPLGLLTLPVASMVWLVASLGVGLAGLRGLVREYLPDRPIVQAVAAGSLLLSWVGVLTLTIGQWGFLLIGALSAVIVLLRHGRPGWAGLAAVGLTAKPQLFVLGAPAIALQAIWSARPGRPRQDGIRFVGVALAATAVLVAVGWVALPSWWPNWLRFAGSALAPDSDTIAALLLTVGGDVALRATPLAIIGLLVIGMRFHPRSEAWLPVWLALSSAATPYSNSYDQILLVVPIVTASGVVARRSRRASTILLSLGTFVLVVVTPLMYWLAIKRHSETLGVLVPLAIFAMIVVALWPLRRAPSVLPVERG